MASLFLILQCNETTFSCFFQAFHIYGLYLLAHADLSRLWFIDNTAALMALVRGKSDAPSLDTMAQVAQVASFALRTRPYYEYVESAANWADEVSRQGLRGGWAKSHGFEMGMCTFVPQLLFLPPGVLARMFAYL